MDINGLYTPVLQIFLIALRVGALWMTFPILSQKNIPGMVKICAALALSTGLLPLVGSLIPAWSLLAPPPMSEIVYVVARELLIGLGMGFVAKWVFTSAVASAHWVGMQVGFSAGSVVNPETETHESSWAEFHQWVALILFLGIGGHWLLIQALSDSYKIDLSLAFQSLSNKPLATAFWVEMGGRFFLWMLKLSGPMVVVVLLLQTAMGVLSRFVPQINVWMVSLPVTIGAGVLLFTLLSPMYSDALSGLFKTTQESSYLWLKFLRGGN